MSSWIHCAARFPVGGLKPFAGKNWRVHTDGDELGLPTGGQHFYDEDGERATTHSLVVSETERGEVLMLNGKGLQVLDDLGKLGEDEVEGSLLEDEIGIVGDCRC